jgi:DNA repair exonuclease SbcCD ATPase subunit
MRATVDGETENYEKARQELVKITEDKAVQARNVKKAETKKQRTLTDIQQIESTLAERSDSYTNNILRQKQETERKIKELTDKRDEIESMVNNVQRDVDVSML